MGTECPFYNSGYEEAKIIKEDGKVVAILGNKDERYYKTKKGKREEFYCDKNFFYVVQPLVDDIV